VNKDQKYCHLCESFLAKSIEKLKRIKVEGHAKTYNFHKNYSIRILIIVVFWGMVQNGIPIVSQSYFKIFIFSQPGLGKTGAKN
jgi:hypothetical protein